MKAQPGSSIEPGDSDLLDDGVFLVADVFFGGSGAQGGFGLASGIESSRIERQVEVDPCGGGVVREVIVMQRDDSNAPNR